MHGRRAFAAVTLALLGLAGAARGASDCPGVDVTSLPYQDSGPFPMGTDDFDVSGLTPCGIAPIEGNGPDFVLNFFSNEDPSFDCIVTATHPVLAVFGGNFPCPKPDWIEADCYDAQVGTEILIPQNVFFFGSSGMVVDALDDPETTFTLTCEGQLPVELQRLTVD